MSNETAIDYHHADAEPPHGHQYLLPPSLKLIEQQKPSRVFDLGCGNGSFVKKLGSLGIQAQGVDPSREGIERALGADANLKVEVGSAYEPLAERFGKFPMLVSQEVIGHVYYPKKFARSVAELLEPGGTAIISTPYHGYLKNLALALTGKMDDHFTALWEHGIIKFWSVATLTQLFAEAGLKCEQVIRAGRVPALAKSMILKFRMPMNPKTDLQGLGTRPLR